MPKLRRPIRAGLVGLTATALVAAGLVTLVGTANAAPVATARLIITPSTQDVSAGTCALFTVTPLDVDSQQASDSGTVTIQLTESPKSATQDVDFCTVTDQTSTPTVGPFYYNGMPTPGVPPGRESQTYAAGASVTPDVNGRSTTTEEQDNPDVASDADMQDPVDGDDNTNPSGRDFAAFTYTNGGTIRFGVAGLTTGGAGILAWKEDSAYSSPPTSPPSPQPGEPQATAMATFTAGGKPGSTQAADAVQTLDAEPEDDAAPPGTAQFFTATVRNSSGHTVAGVTPLIRVTNGPNMTAIKQIRADCGASNNSGVATCAWQGADPGVDSLVVYVNRTGGTAGPDAVEAQDEITRTTTGATNTNAAQARFVDLVPDAATTSAGQSRDFTAIVTDKDGKPVLGVTVTFSETGPGALEGGVSTKPKTTDSAGRATITAITAIGQTGTQTITSTIAQATTDCELAAGNPFGAAAGRCADTATHNIVVAPSPSPTASATPSASPSATATPTGTASPTATATPGSCSVTPTVSLQPTTINATGSGGVTVSGPAGRQIELFAYSQPSTTYRVVRTGTLSSSGTISFTVRPPTNTRLYAQIVGCDTDDVRFSRVLNVRTTLSLNVVRNGTQDYTFSGDSLPARPGGLIVSLYRFNEAGGRVLTAQARANATTGDWLIRRVFTGTGRFDFQVRTGQDLQNAPGQSNIRSLLIF